MKVKTATLIQLPARISQLNVAVSGINFALLCIVSMVLIRLAIPADPTEPGTWLADPANRRGVYFALHLVPFMGLAFLWFMAVLRHRIGTDAGRLESTVFLGSGMLFVGTLFAAAAITRGLMDTVIAERFHFTRDTYEIGRSVTYTLVTVFGIRMGAAFIFATSALARRAGILPKWLAYVGYAVGNVLLLVIKDFAWIELLFPSWVLLVSLYILIADLRRGWRGEVPLSPGPDTDL
jgi:hypothetical protein